MAPLHIPRRILRLQTVAVAGDSMAPTYHDGDWLLTRWGGRYKVGQVLIVERNERPGIYLVKRLVRVEGGKYWVEGDNPLASTDSRQWGFLDSQEILGRVFFRYRRSASS